MSDDIPVTPGYSVREISFRSRVLKAGAISAFALLWAGAIWVEQYEKGTLERAWGPLLGLLFALFVAWNIWATKHRKVYAGEWVEIPAETRHRKALLCVLVQIAACGGGWWIWAATGWPGIFTFVGAVVLGVGGQLAYVLTTKRTFVLSPEGAEAKKQDETPATAEPTPESIEVSRKFDEFTAGPLFRYPVAGLLGWIAWYVADSRPDIWWVSVVLVLFAAGLAREMTLVVLAIGIGYLAFQGLASLPVSAAIIIGALIIASALKER